MIVSLPIDNTIEALRVLQAHGWRARPAGHFVRRVGNRKEMLYPVARGWRHLRGGGWSQYVGATLADAAYRLHGDEMLDAGLGALLLRGLAVEMGAEYTPVVEAVR